MNAIISLVLVVALFVFALLAAQAPVLLYLMGVLLPYAALVIFILGLILRVRKWASTPVPFRIPTTAGQEKSLDWINNNELDNPSTTWGVVKRMALEILLFRSLFRNTQATVNPDQGRVGFWPDKLLWLAGLAFHYTFLVILIRHLRFFVESGPVFCLVNFVRTLDGFFQIYSPTLYLSALIFMAAVTALLLRRILIPQVRYISLAADYFPLFLIGAIGISGLWMAYISKVDIEAVKVFTMGFTRFSFAAPNPEIGAIFYAHMALVSVLFAYFPFSKLLHSAGVFFSPTRNLANNNRAVRHENPWNPEVKTHPYDEYEDEFRERMVKMNIPVEKPLEETSAKKEE